MQAAGLGAVYTQGFPSQVLWAWKALFFLYRLHKSYIYNDIVLGIFHLEWLQRPNLCTLNHKMPPLFASRTIIFHVRDCTKSIGKQSKIVYVATYAKLVVNQPMFFQKGLLFMMENLPNLSHQPKSNSE